MIQLNPPIPLMTPEGPALAHFLLDYGPESDLFWTVFVDGTGECWTFNNRDIRACKNVTLGRGHISGPHRSANSSTGVAAPGSAVAMNGRYHGPAQPVD